MSDYQRLAQEVKEISSAIDAAVVAFQGVANSVREVAMQPNPEENLSALADELDAAANRLAVAIAANTNAEDDSDEVSAETVAAEDGEGGEEPVSGPDSDSYRSGEGVTGADSATDTNLDGGPSTVASAEDAAAESGNAESPASSDDSGTTTGEAFGDDEQPSAA